MTKNSARKFLSELVCCRRKPLVKYFKEFIPISYFINFLIIPWRATIVDDIQKYVQNPIKHQRLLFFNQASSWTSDRVLKTPLEKTEGPRKPSFVLQSGNSQNVRSVTSNVWKNKHRITYISTYITYITSNVWKNIH